MSTEDRGNPENGDLYNSEGDHIGNIDPPQAIGDMIDLEIGIFFEGHIYCYKFDYRTKAITKEENKGAG
jgi:hypothetical protein